MFKCLTRNCFNNEQNIRQMELTSATDKTPPFSLNGLITNAKCTKCYDADTVHLVFHHQNKLSRWTCRLIGIDSAEIKSKDQEEKKFAIISRDYLKDMILDKIVSIKCGKFDKYGRLLVTISYNGQDINQHLLDKVAFSEWHKK